MKKGLKTGLASKTGAVVLALSFAAGSAGNAWAACAGPQEMSALRAAALRQHLMVAALSCHEAGYFNRFVTAYQAQFQDSDHDLMQFFDRQGSGENGYNAYKTREANDSSLRSLSDSRFCAAAEAAFHIAVHGDLPLAQLADEEAPLLHTGYASCERSAGTMEASLVSPSFPARHKGLVEAAAPQPVAAPPERVAEAAPPPANMVEPVAPQQDDAVAPAPAPDTVADNAYQNTGYYQPAYAAPYPYNAYSANAWYAPPPMRQVMAPDGSWYLVPAYR